MKELTAHPFMSRRTVKAYESNNGKYIEVIDVRDLFHGNYAVSFETWDGGLTDIYSSVSLEKCIAKAINYANTH